MGKTLILMASSRSDGDCSNICKQLFEKHDLDYQDLNDLVILPYSYDHDQEDDYIEFMTFVIATYDTLILASPVYWYNLSATAKTFMDRKSDLVRIRKDLGRQMRGKNLLLICNSIAYDCLESYADSMIHSANYLGMNWLGHVHFPIEQPEVVEQRIIEFSKKLIK